jgi:hypothetical protein
MEMDNRTHLNSQSSLSNTTVTKYSYPPVIHSTGRIFDLSEGVTEYRWEKGSKKKKSKGEMKSRERKET